MKKGARFMAMAAMMMAGGGMIGEETDDRSLWGDGSQYDETREDIYLSEPSKPHQGKRKLSRKQRKK